MTPQEKLELLLDRIAEALIQSPLVNTLAVENNQKFILNGQLEQGGGAGVLALFQKDIKANADDLNTFDGDGETVLKSYTEQINNFNSLLISISEGTDFGVSIKISGGGLSSEYDITEFLVQDGTFSNVSQFIPLSQQQSNVDIDKANEFLDTNIFELLPTGDARQQRIIRFFQELNALLPPSIDDSDWDSDNDGRVDREQGTGNWEGTNQYNQDNSISYAQDNQDGNIDEEDAFIHRLTGTANDTNSTRTIEEIYNRVLPYLRDILEEDIDLEDGRPEYRNQSSGYLQFRNPNQGIIVRNTNQEFIEGLNPSNPTYLNTDGTGGFTITMWVRFLDKVSEGTLFNFGNPIRGFNGDSYSNGYVDDDAFGFTLETFVLNKDDTTGNTNYPTWGDVSPTITNYNSANAFDNSNTARFVRLMINDNGQLRDSTVGFEMGTNYGQKLNTTIPFKPEIIQEDNGVPGSYTMRLFGSTLIPEDFNEWYFICASFNPLIPEDSSHAEASDWSEFTPEYWLNHMPTEDTYVSNSNLGNKCKVEIISRSDLLRARGFKVD